MTAAHCLRDEPTATLTASSKRFNIRKSAQNEKGIEFKVLKVHIHPDYQIKTSNNDIAVLVVKVKNNWSSGRVETVAYSKSVQSPRTNTLLSAIGWGYTKNEGRISNTLQETSLISVAFAECQIALQTNSMSRKTICAMSESSTRITDTCSGDSGGPLFSINMGKATVHGIVSWGEECALKGKPGVYTKIAHYNSWLANIERTNRV